MLKVARILKDYRASGALNALVNVHAAVGDQTFLTKAGDLVMMLAMDGVDYECLDASELDHLARRFESGLRNLDERFRLYQYLVKRDDPGLPGRTYDNAIVQKAIDGRMAYLRDRAKTLYSLEIYFAVAYEDWSVRGRFADHVARFRKAPLASLRAALSPRQTVRVLDTELDRAIETLTQKVTSFVIQLPDVLHARVLDRQQAFRLLRVLLNYAPHKVDSVRLKHDAFVDFQACDSALECHRDHLRLDDFYVQVLTLKEPPAQTFAHVLRDLQELPCKFIIASEWKRETHGKVRSLLQSKRRHFHNSKTSVMSYLNTDAKAPSADRLVDDSAVALVSDLGSALRDLEVTGRTFGEFSMTVVLFDEDRAALRRAVAECFKIFAAHDAQLLEERYNLLNAFLAVLPGNRAYNLRRFWVTDANCADLSFLFRLHTGEVDNAHLGTEYLAVLETNHRTPYFFNLHYHDIAHSLILGATGSGKSFLVNFLLTHLQKYGPLTYIFDLGGSYEHLTRLFGGSYLPVGTATRALKINPFSLEPTADNLHFLLAFLKVLIESTSFRLSAQDERDLFEQIENLYVVEPEQRRLFTLSNLVNRNVRVHLQKWVQGGAFGDLFDNVNDTLTFARFQTFDFEGMDKVPDVLEPLLFYILHRANAALGDPALAGTFKAFVIDEAWRFLRHPTTKLYILEALKTWRKKNAGMLLATQSSDDLLRSEMLSVVVESCATKMFLANPDMDIQHYREIFHLNETEAGLITRLLPKRQILVKRPDRAKVMNLNVSPQDYWLYTSNPQERQRREDAFDRYGLERGLEVLAGRLGDQEGKHP